MKLTNNAISQIVAESIIKYTKENSKSINEEKLNELGPAVLAAVKPLITKGISALAKKGVSKLAGSKIGSSISKFAGSPMGGVVKNGVKQLANDFLDNLGNSTDVNNQENSQNVQTSGQEDGNQTADNSKNENTPFTDKLSDLLSNDVHIDQEKVSPDTGDINKAVESVTSESKENSNKVSVNEDELRMVIRGTVNEVLNKMNIK